MTNRISHEQAKHLAGGIIAEQFPATSADLLAYISQQRAAEADTVSRAEHEAAFGALRALAAWCRANYLLDKGLPEELHEAEELFRGSSYGTNGDMYKSVNRRRAEAAETQLTALQAEHERVKLDFANTCDVGRKLEARVAQLIAEAQGHEARVAELEEEREAEWDDAYKIGYCDGTCDAKQLARRLGDKNPHRKPAPSIEAGRVQTSPFQQVAEASVQPAPGGNPHSGSDFTSAFTAEELAEIRPGGVERLAEKLVPTKSCDNCGAVDEMCEKIGCLSDVEKADPTPADQPVHAYWREGEDASLDLHIRQREARKPDYVTRGELERLATDVVEALRSGCGEGGLRRAAEELEKARKP